MGETIKYISAQIIIKGRVQGVGFRYFAKQKADEIGITGWVRNLPNGFVEIEAYGTPDRLEIFTDWMKTGPARSRIDSVTSTLFDAGFIPERFTLRY